MLEPLTEKVEQIVRPFLDKRGVLLVGLNVRQQGGTAIVQILADKERGGITLAECAGLNRDIGFALEQADIFDNRYVIEVSSPGLDRPLKTGQDFVRAIGKEAHLFLLEPVENRPEHIGFIKEVQPEAVMIDVDGVTLSIPLNKIKEAKYIIE